MKRFIFYILAWVGVLSLASCEKDLPVYSDSTSRLNFYYDISQRKILGRNWLVVPILLSMDQKRLWTIPYGLKWRPWDL